MLKAGDRVVFIGHTDGCYCIDRCRWWEKQFLGLHGIVEFGEDETCTFVSVIFDNGRIIGCPAKHFVLENALVV
jgi:hypothetical protein